MGHHFEPGDPVARVTDGPNLPDLHVLGQFERVTDGPNLPDLHVLGRPWDEQTEANKRHAAERDIQNKWAELHGAPGAPTTPGDGGLISIGDNFYREYANGGIYYSVNFAEPLFVYGAIGERYRQLGGPNSWLRWPTSEEMDFPEGGRVRTFESGDIYWWPETGPRELNNVTVQYTGLYCFGETDIDAVFSSDDEPYATIGVAGPDGTTGTFRSQIYQGVDAGEGRFDIIEIYQGKPRGLLLTTVLQEHSGGDTEISRAVVKEGVEKGGAALAAAASAVPGIGPVLGPVAVAALIALKDDIADALNSFVERTLGLADRPLGEDLIELTPKRMVVLGTRPEGHALQDDIPWKFETKLLERFGASYKLYFNIFPV